MSYILEALKKVEQQREIGRVPGIGSGHERISGRIHRRWLWLISGVLLLNAGLLIAMLWPDSEPETVTEKAGIEPAKKMQGQELPATDNPPTLRPPEQPLAPPVQAALQSRTQPLPEPPENEPVVRTVPETRVVAAPPLSRTHDPAAARKKVTKPAPPELPIWPQLPSHLLQQLNGSLRLDVHVYSDQPQERFVLINLQKYHQGDQLQEGPQLDEITPKGVILSFRGQRFQVQAQ